MASGTMKSQNVKRMTMTGTTNQYGALMFNSDLTAIASRICGIAQLNRSQVNVNIMYSDNRWYFACYNIQTSSAYGNESIEITVAYI